MNEQITARECVKALCSAWFERRSMEETIVFFADDVMFIGTGEGESAHGKNEMANYITQDIQEIPEPFTVGVTIVHEQQDVYKRQPLCPVLCGNRSVLLGWKAVGTGLRRKPLRFAGKCG